MPEILEVTKSWVTVCRKSWIFLLMEEYIFLTYFLIDASVAFYKPTEKKPIHPQKVHLKTCVIFLYEINFKEGGFMRTFQNIQKISHKELLSQTKSLVLKERSLHTQILQHLSEIKSRQLHLKMGFSSLFEYAVKELGYSEGAAYRRIQAMKLCQQVPETAQKIQEGKLSLSSASQIQTFFEKKVKQEREQKAEKSPPPKNPLTPSSPQKETQQLGFSLTEKKRILQEVEGNSTRDTMKLLAQKDPSLALPTEKVRYLGGGKVEIRLVVDEGCQKRLESLLHLLAHKNPSLSYAELLSILSQEAIQKHDPMLKKVKRSTLTSPQKLASTKPPEEVKSMTTHSRQELEGEIKKLSSEVKKIQKCSEQIRTTSPQKLASTKPPEEVKSMTTHSRQELEGEIKKLSSEVKKIQKCSEQIRTTSPQKLEKKEI